MIKLAGRAANGSPGLSARSALAGALILSVMTIAQAPQAAPKSASPTEARLECAKRDLALITLLEDLGPSAASHKLDEAFRTMIRARTACGNGDFEAGYGHYDEAMSSLARQ